MKNEINQFLWKMFVGLARSKQKDMAHLARIRAAMLYVKGVQTMRLTVVGCLGISLLCVLLCGGFILFHVGLFFYLPGSIAVKGLILAVLGAIYLLIAITVLASLSSERFWMRMSKADETVKRAVKNESLCSGDKEE